MHTSQCASSHFLCPLFAVLAANVMSAFPTITSTFPRVRWKSAGKSEQKNARDIIGCRITDYIAWVKTTITNVNKKMPSCRLWTKCMQPIGGTIEIEKRFLIPAHIKCTHRMHSLVVTNFQQFCVLFCSIFSLTAIFPMLTHVKKNRCFNNSWNVAVHTNIQPIDRIRNVYLCAS